VTPPGKRHGKCTPDPSPPGGGAVAL
jgi:hypothetical protein